MLDLHCKHSHTTGISPVVLRIQHDILPAAVFQGSLSVCFLSECLSLTHQNGYGTVDLKKCGFTAAEMLNSFSRSQRFILPEMV